MLRPIQLAYFHHFFIEVHAPRQESQWSFIGVFDVLILPLSTVLPLGLETVHNHIVF